MDLRQPVAGVIAHGTFNAVLGRLDQAAVTTDVGNAAYLTGETGVFTLAAVWITAVVLARRYPSVREAEAERVRVE
jgi:hypothetical protein